MAVDTGDIEPAPGRGETEISEICRFSPGQETVLSKSVVSVRKVDPDPGELTFGPYK